MITREKIIFVLFATPFLVASAVSAIYGHIWLMAIFQFGLIFASIPFGAFILFPPTNKITKEVGSK